LVREAQRSAKAGPGNTPIYFALYHFLRNTVDLTITEASAELIKDDPSALPDVLAEIKKRAAAGTSRVAGTIIGIKANEAVLSGKR